MCEKQRKDKFVSASVASDSVGNLKSETISISIDVHFIINIEKIYYWSIFIKLNTLFQCCCWYDSASPRCRKSVRSWAL